MVNHDKGSARTTRRRRRRARLAVDLRAALGLTGTLVKYLSASAVAPAGVALIYSEPPWPFLAAGAIALIVGLMLERVGRDATTVGFREGYLVVSLIWLLAALFGALPYLFADSPQFDNPVNALFESMSGSSLRPFTLASGGRLEPRTKPNS